MAAVPRYEEQEEQLLYFEIERNTIPHGCMICARTTLV